MSSELHLAGFCFGVDVVDMCILQPDFMRNVLGIVAGNGLLTVEGQEHKLMRKAMNPAFSLPNLAARQWSVLL